MYIMYSVFFNPFSYTGTWCSWLSRSLSIKMFARGVGFNSQCVHSFCLVSRWTPPAVRPRRQPQADTSGSSLWTGAFIINMRLSGVFPSAHLHTFLPNRRPPCQSWFLQRKCYTFVVCPCSVCSTYIYWQVVWEPFSDAAKPASLTMTITNRNERPTLFTLKVTAPKVRVCSLQHSRLDEFMMLSITIALQHKSPKRFDQARRER